MYWLIGIAVIVMVVIMLLKAPVRLIRMLNRAAMLACQRKDWAGAANYYREAHEVAGKLTEPKKSKLEALVELEWAGVFHRQGRMREADEMFRSGFAKLTCTHPEELAVVQHAHLNYGDLCTDEGRHCDAERHYRKALAVDESTGNLGLIIFDLQRLGDSLIRQGRREEAEEVIHRAIALETQVVHMQLLREGRDPGQVQIRSMSMPDLQFCREQYEDARRLYREKVQHWGSQVTRPDNIDLGHLQMRLALSEWRTGNLDQAIEMYTQAEATFRREWCEHHPKALAARAAMEALVRDMAPVQP